MYIESVPNRNSPPAVLLRESFRDAGKVNKRTLANLSKWPPTLIEGLRVLLKGGAAVPRLEEAFDIVRSKPHGHVAAVLGTLRKLRLDRTIAGADSPERRRVLAMIVARVLDPGSKLATARGLPTTPNRFDSGDAGGPVDRPRRCGGIRLGRGLSQELAKRPEARLGGGVVHPLPTAPSVFQAHGPVDKACTTPPLARA